MLLAACGQRAGGGGEGDISIRTARLLTDFKTPFGRFYARLRGGLAPKRSAGRGRRAAPYRIDGLLLLVDGAAAAMHRASFGECRPYGSCLRTKGKKLVWQNLSVIYGLSGVE